MAEVNLFSDDVVIILGAGASVPFGLPTGVELINQSIDILKDEISNCNSKIEHHFARQNWHIAPLSYALPPISADLELDTYKEYFEPLLTSIETFLRNQTSDSIDDIIRYSKEKSESLKILIAYCLFKNLYFQNSHLDKFCPMPFHERKLAFSLEPTRNWVHNLINIVRNKFDSSWSSVEDYMKDLRKEKISKVKVISFNYDGILEYLLTKCWNDVDAELPDWELCFEIVHPHGLIPLRPEISSRELPQLIKDWGNEIVVVNEKSELVVESAIYKHRQRADAMISKANEIFAMGFAFSNSNCKTIGLDRWDTEESAKRINYINFDKNPGLDARVRSLEFKYRHSNGDINESKGVHIGKREVNQNGQYLQITDALMGGFLGEMPS